MSMALLFRTSGTVSSPRLALSRLVLLHRTRCLYLLGVAVAITSCAEPTLVEQQPRTVSVVGDPDSTVWNRLDADVVVKMSNATKARPAFMRSTAMGYHLTKRRGSDGRWLTEIRYDHVLPVDKATGTNSRPRGPQPVAKAVFDGSQPMAMYDAAGRAIPMPTRAQVGEFADRTRGLPRQLRTRPQATGLPTLASDSAGNDGWIDRFIVGSGAGSRERMRLSRASAQLLRRAGSRASYVISRGDRRTEVTLNESTGAVETIRVTERGQLVGLTERQWTRTATGVSVLSLERVTRYANDGTSPPMTVEVSYRNVATAKED